MRSEMNGRGMQGKQKLVGDGEETMNEWVASEMAVHHYLHPSRFPFH